MIHRRVKLRSGVKRRVRAAVVPWIGSLLVVVAAGMRLAAEEPRAHGTAAAAGAAPTTPNPPAQVAAAGVNPPTSPEPTRTWPGLENSDVGRALPTVALFGAISLAPVGLLMLTAFVRINIVLTLLRQAVGSPQVPGNQVLTALALLLTALVMWPVGEVVYREAVLPYASGQLPPGAAWTAGARPIKAFMLDQIKETRHQDYLEMLHESTAPPSPERILPPPERPEDFPLRVVAPAFLLSELTTALMMGFYLYLPFLVIDLVVASVLAATGLFMLPPALVATPVKLVLFVLADGWMLVAAMLLSSFRVAGGGP